MKIFSFFCIISVLCVKANGHGRIVGGIESSIERRPFQASLQVKSENTAEYSHYCGASILNVKYLLSAAHCVIEPATYMYARVGSTEVYNGGQVIKVLNFISHPEYNRNTLDYDFSIVALAGDIVFGPNVVAVQLVGEPNQDPSPAEMVTVSGWGVTDEINTEISEILMEVDLPVWDSEKCKNVYAFLTPRHMCLGGTPAGGTSACFGDSGGPVTFGNMQVALVSGGYSCVAPNTPGLYARISTAVDWIKENSKV